MAAYVKPMRAARVRASPFDRPILRLCRGPVRPTARASDAIGDALPRIAGSEVSTVSGNASGDGECALDCETPRDLPYCSDPCPASKIARESKFNLASTTRPPRPWNDNSRDPPQWRTRGRACLAS